MQRRSYLRLSGMMFLFYVAAGAHIPLLSLYLNKVLGFSGVQTGTILSMSALSAVAAPLIGSFIADRLLSAERVLAISQIGSAALMWLLTMQEQYLPFLVLYIIFQMLFGPGVALTNAIVFHQAPDARRQFSSVRLWGTAGWIVAAWFFSFLWLERPGSTIGDALRFTSLVSSLLGAYALTLAPKPQAGPRRRELIPRAALRILLQPRVLVVALVGLVVQMVDKYYYFGTGPFLDAIGVSESAIMPAMSLGQATELLSMLAMSALLARFSYRRMLLMGIFMELARFAFLILSAVTQSAVPAYIGIAFHGPAFAFFFSTAFIYVDSFTDSESRAGVQQLFNLITMGVGNFLGSLVAGAVFDASVINGSVRYTWFWGVPAVLVTAMLGVLASLRLRRR
ncbi:MAG TPA: MFS transporter [Clostridia bacterium]|nr:MFS transporter [Clostridia bacterium]